MDARFRFSDSTAELDRDTVHAWLSEQSYWAEGRSRELQDRAIDGSRNFGVYDAETGEQVAYARVVTDAATFAWLCDVFVSDEVRGRGVGVGLIAGVCAWLDTLALKRTMLATRDAHGLYAKFGFEAVANPEMWMARAAH